MGGGEWNRISSAPPERSTRGSENVEWTVVVHYEAQVYTRRGPRHRVDAKGS